MLYEEKEIRVSNPPARPVLAYDGDCGFCKLMVSRWSEWLAGAMDIEPAAIVAKKFTEIPRENFERSIHLITPDGKVAIGAGAIFEALSISGHHGWLWKLHQRFPFFERLTETAYNFTARHRSTFSRFIRIFYGRDFAHPTFSTSSSIFFRLLGLIYLIAFLSLGSQIIGLAGENGIVPAARLMEVARDQHAGFAQLPTLCHFTGASDNVLRLLCASGIVVSIAMMLGLLPVIAAAAAWLLYLSLCTVIEPFLSFQWDALLLECGFLAIFLAPFSLALRPGRARFSRLARWLLVWLLFRLMFASGVVKLASGDQSWWDLTALSYHYWSQCLPPWTAWYFDKLPMWAHKVSCVIMFAIELVVPFCVFFPRRFRHFAAICILALMAVIMASGNYGFFDLLTCALCLLLFDDHAWKRLAARIRRRPRPDVTLIQVVPTSPIAARIFRDIAVPPLLLVFALTWIPFTRIVIGAQQICGAQAPWQPSHPQWLVQTFGHTLPFRSINGYGLFAVMTKQRDEIILEGTADGVTWRTYEFKWKPGDLAQAPRFTTPHMPRLDWQMWFAALGDYNGNAWLIGTAVRLLEGQPTVLALLDENPFPDKPPRAIRAYAYRYHFTTAAERSATGHWWKRDEPPREYFPAIGLNKGLPARVRFERASPNP